ASLAPSTIVIALPPGGNLSKPKRQPWSDSFSPCHRKSFSFRNLQRIRPFGWGWVRTSGSLVSSAIPTLQSKNSSTSWSKPSTGAYWNLYFFRSTLPDRSLLSICTSSLGLPSWVPSLKFLPQEKHFPHPLSSIA